MKTGRPKKPIDKEQLEKLAVRYWSVEQIAAFFRVGRKTIERRYGETIKRCYARAKSNVRDLQWKRAAEGSDRMILHLSKHLLGEHDKLVTEQKITQTNEVIIENPGITLRSHIKPSREQ